MLVRWLLAAGCWLVRWLLTETLGLGARCWWGRVSPEPLTEQMTVSSDPRACAARLTLRTLAGWLVFLCGCD